MAYKLVIGSYKQVLEFQEESDAWQYAVDNLWLDPTVHVVSSNNVEKLQELYKLYEIQRLKI